MYKERIRAAVPRSPGSTRPSGSLCVPEPPPAAAAGAHGLHLCPCCPESLSPCPAHSCSSGWRSGKSWGVHSTGPVEGGAALDPTDAPSVAAESLQLSAPGADVLVPWLLLDVAGPVGLDPTKSLGGR
eukprot:1157768-Pelagomonas_calceolata.AAC.7